MTPEKLSRIHVAAFAPSRGWTPSEFETLLTDPGVVLTADRAAFALGRVVLDEAELLTIATHPDGQRLGLARLVLSRWHEQIADRGATRIFLEVAEDNFAARSLYAAAGYQAAGRRTGYYHRPSGQRMDAILLSRAIG